MAIPPSAPLRSAAAVETLQRTEPVQRAELLQSAGLMHGGGLLRAGELQLPADTPATVRSVYLAERLFVTAGRFVLLAATLVLAACAGSRDVERPPDDRFGHRYEEEGPEGRRTIAILPPDSAVSYFYYPVVVDTVHARPALPEGGPVPETEVPVEVLVKGSLPDGCTELHEVSQERYGHIIHLDVRTRRPQGAICTRVNRPYRFYVRLDGLYREGHYTLKLNDRIFSFAIRMPDAG